MLLTYLCKLITTSPIIWSEHGVGTNPVVARLKAGWNKYCPYKAPVSLARLISVDTHFREHRPVSLVYHTREGKHQASKGNKRSCCRLSWGDHPYKLFCRSA